MKEGRDPSAAAAAAAGAALRSLARNVPCGVGRGGTRDGAASACLPAFLPGRLGACARRRGLLRQRGPKDGERMRQRPLGGRTRTRAVLLCGDDGGRF